MAIFPEGSKNVLVTTKANLLMRRVLISKSYFIPLALYVYITKEEHYTLMRRFNIRVNEMIVCCMER